ncbi:immunity 49 family protein [Streptomyces sp. NPDC059650]|uniref:immunity 49 family protein n=1 Tax=Streptomyces sp. NPDC059650 TaxID=3346896 RepID=UPI003687FF0C
MEVFHRVVRRDDEGFDRAFTAALQLHGEYWNADGRATRVSGLVALAPLAMARFAREAGIRIEVESDYVPATLLNGNSCGEFPT